MVRGGGGVDLINGVTDGVQRGIEAKGDLSRR